MMQKARFRYRVARRLKPLHALHHAPEVTMWGCPVCFGALRWHVTGGRRLTWAMLVKHLAASRSSLDVDSAVTEKHAVAEAA